MISFYLTKISYFGVEQSCVSMNWLQSHQAIRHEINTAVETVTARKVLVRGQTEERSKKRCCHMGWHQQRFINIFFQEILKINAMLSKSIKHFSLNMGRILAILTPLPSKANTTFFEKWAHKSLSCDSEATYTILRTKTLWIIYLFAYRNMYFYYTFRCFTYRICILSIQHIPGRYIKYAHSSCCSVHPLKRSVSERHGIVYTCWKYTLHKSSGFGCFRNLFATPVLWLLKGLLSNWGKGKCHLRRRK